MSWEGSTIYSRIVEDIAEDTAEQDHQMRLRGHEPTPATIPGPQTVNCVTEYVTDDCGNYIWVNAWMDLRLEGDTVEVRVLDALLDRCSSMSIDAETARTLGRYLCEAAHNLDLRAKEREEETK